MKFHNEMGNIQIYLVDRPDIVSFYYENANKNDVHNHLRQGCLKLEKKWITRSAYFRLESTRLGICVIDALALASHHHLFDKQVSNQIGGKQRTSFTAKKFSGILARQLIILADRLNDNGLEMEHRMNRQLSYDGESDSDDDFDSNGGGLGVAKNKKRMKMTLKEYEYEKKPAHDHVLVKPHKLYSVKIEKSYTDVNSSVHSVVKNPTKGYDKRGWEYSRRNTCDSCTCRNTCIFLCRECNLFFCWFSKNTQSCFIQHVEEI
jgi:hypothetical protein